MANSENRIATQFTEEVLKIRAKQTNKKNNRRAVYMGINQNSFTSNKSWHKADSFL